MKKSKKLKNGFNSKINTISSLFLSKNVKWTFRGSQKWNFKRKIWKIRQRGETRRVFTTKKETELIQGRKRNKKIIVFEE